MLDPAALMDDEHPGGIAWGCRAQRDAVLGQLKIEKRNVHAR
jgi:hypothetical protein